MYKPTIILSIYLFCFVIIWITDSFEYAVIVTLILAFLIILWIGIHDYLSEKFKKNLEQLRSKYPKAYQSFYKSTTSYKENRELDFSDTCRLVSFKEYLWEQEEKEILTKEYNALKCKYPCGFSCWEKESKYKSMSVAVLSRAEIIKYDKNQKEFLCSKEWMTNQMNFSTLCQSKDFQMPHSGYTHYDIRVPAKNYLGDEIWNKHNIYQFFFSEYCVEADLNYTYHHHIREHYCNLKEYAEGKINVPNYIIEEISNFIKSLGETDIILYEADTNHNAAMDTFCMRLKEMGITVNEFSFIKSIASNNIIIIDNVTSNEDFVTRCKEVIERYKLHHPCIVYISLMKEYTLNEMQMIINRKLKEKEEEDRRENEKKENIKRKELEEKRKREEIKKQQELNEKKKEAEIKRKELEEKRKQEEIKRQQELKEKGIKQVRNVVEQISRAIDTAEIEVANEKIDAIKTMPAYKSIDKELEDMIQKEEERFNHNYELGIVDTFEIQRVNYSIPSTHQTNFNWDYPVVKYPQPNCIVFPYRRRRIARRGYIEAKFQSYISVALIDTKLLILGDVNILPSDDTRPYEPDIAIICKEYPSIRIDIEIDEPYAAISKRPIHYISCGDDFRDINLNNLGWIVIRFTEYQVFSDPKGCAGFIAKILHAISPSLKLPESLITCPLPEKVERWTEIEAKLMASEKKRENYLNHEFGNIDNEPLTTADIKQTERERECAALIKPLVIQDNTESLLIKSDYPTLLRDRDSEIQFFEFEHIYLYRGKVRFTPVSNIISFFFEPFDANYWSLYKANQRHVPQGQVLEEWDYKGAKSREVGTFMHKQIENYYNNLEYESYYHFKYSGKYIHTEENVEIKTEKEQFEGFLQDHTFEPFRTEWTIYDEDLEIAGTIDMIHQNEDATFDIYDWKRSHKITDSFGRPISVNSFGNHGIHGLEQIDDTSYQHYCIQQNLYMYILEKNYNVKVNKMFLVVFTENNMQYTKLEVPRMDDTIHTIIEKCQNKSVQTYLEAKGNQI